jgi:hypothetical protein
VNKGVKTFSDMWLADSLNVDPARLSEVCLERVDVNRLARVVISYFTLRLKFFCSIIVRRNSALCPECEHVDTDW